MPHVSYKPSGRLGNALYQASVSIAYSIKHRLRFSMPSKTNDNFWNPIYLQHLISPDFNPDIPFILINELQHHYYELPFDETWRDKNILLSGYFQSYKYINDYRPEILYLFGLPYQFNEGEVAVHIRRGDYLVHVAKHPYVSEQWYERAMNLPQFRGSRFRFFSDDIKWCKEKFGHREDCSFSEGLSELDDLIQMSWSEHQICSSSTFSVWAHWLNRNENKTGVFPDKWFSEGWCGLQTQDIVEPHCIKLPL
jgi:hypothetical protein